jgi:hypothetical protein
VIIIPILNPKAVPREPDTTTWEEYVNDSSGYLACYLKCMKLDLGLEAGAELGGAEEVGRRFYTLRYPRWFKAGGRYSKVLVPQFANRLSGLLAAKSLCETAHCFQKCWEETSGLDPDPNPIPPYSGGPVNAPVVIR